jgi:hypothetical protein
VIGKMRRRVFVGAAAVAASSAAFGGVAHAGGQDGSSGSDGEAHAYCQSAPANPSAIATQCYSEQAANSGNGAGY